MLEKVGAVADKIAVSAVFGFFVSLLIGLVLLVTGCELLDRDADKTATIAESSMVNEDTPPAAPSDGAETSQLKSEENAIPPAATESEQEPSPAQEPGSAASAENADPPIEAVKLVFIHHSVGENWLADGDGGLGLALMENNYFVSDTNYGWGPDGIGDRTDIPDWLEWFRSLESSQYLAALYANNSNYSEVYSRANNPEPDRENEIVLFKSCYPNSNLEGRADDPPADTEPYSVSHAKYVYLELLDYFASRQDKLFVAITAPPITNDDSWAPPENTRAFNNWLVTEWLADYPYDNVAVFDFYNVLTSNGGDPSISDEGEAGGNHHRWWNGEVQHVQDIDNDLAAYPSDDSHPNSAGNRKATAEFVPLLNVFYNRWRNGPVSENEGVSTPSSTGASAGASAFQTTPTRRLQPEQLVYAGAFRLPDEGPYEIGWAWSGEALAYNPDGDPDGPADGFPGSLFGTGHNFNQYVSEITIPEPVISLEKDLQELNTAETLQPFTNIRDGLFDHLDFELPRAGLAYESPGRLHFCWGQHLQGEGPQPSHGWSSTDLSQPGSVGPWLIGDFNVYATNDYLLPVPESWSDTYAPGMVVASGRFRDGGWGGQGPSLIAYMPGELDSESSSNVFLESLPLLLYAGTQDGETLSTELRMNGYHHSDEWNGAAWLEKGDQAAVVFDGTKGIGDCWYGFANGVIWPDEAPYPEVPEPPNDDRGWWSTAFEGQLIFYDPNDFSAVALGEMAPYNPQPYAAFSFDPYLFNNHSAQQKYHLGDITFDRKNGRLFVLEPLVDEDKPIIHVWTIAS